VVVVGVPDDHWGEAIVAAVVTVPGSDPDPEVLRAYVRERLRGSRTPDRIVFLDDLPATATGKILRKRVVADIVESSTAGHP
jgi:acyl-CoA synthetase (AMP-forming)/AMP-acid ligase II